MALLADHVVLFSAWIWLLLLLVFLRGLDRFIGFWRLDSSWFGHCHWLDSRLFIWQGCPLLSWRQPLPCCSQTSLKNRGQLVVRILLWFVLRIHLWFMFKEDTNLLLKDPLLLDPSALRPNPLLWSILLTDQCLSWTSQVSRIPFTMSS